MEMLQNDPYFYRTTDGDCRGLTNIAAPGDPNYCPYPERSCSECEVLVGKIPEKIKNEILDKIAV